MLKENKVVLITGCSRGIGFAIAKLLAEKGYSVYATVKNLKTCHELIKISEKYNNLHVYKIDVTNELDINCCINKIIKKEKTIDVLINNAAYILFGPVETLSIKQIQDQFEVNFFGVIRMIQAVAPFMRKANKGHIICMGSTSGVASSPMYGAYSASKFSLESLMYSLAVNLLYWNINVSMIEISATSTQICEKSLIFGCKSIDEAYEKYVKNSYNFLSNIIKNGENPENIARSVLNVIENKPVALRSMATRKAEEIFSENLKDPSCLGYLQSFHDEKEWYKDG